MQLTNESMAMAEAMREGVERATVYLTPLNKQRLSRLRRGEKTKKLNEALNLAFEQEELKKSFETFMGKLDRMAPVKPSISSTDAIRMLRDGRDHDLTSLTTKSR